MRILISLSLGLIYTLYPGLSSGQIHPDPTASEVSLLPEYCKHTQVFKDRFSTIESYNQWQERMGPTFSHLHHYCWGMVAIQRTNKPGVTKQDRDHWLRTSVNEIEYVLRNAESSFVLLPELLTRRGVSLSKLKQFSAAEESFRRAIESKLDYWPAHLGLAQLFVDRGDKSAARKYLEQSIPQVSDDRMLKRMLADLQRAPQ